MTGTGPILVTGPDRSGTTLLYALLASHPDIAMVRRTNLWRWFDRRYGDLSDQGNFDRCLEGLVSYRRLHVLEPEVDRIREEFRRGEATYGRLFGILHEQHAARQGRRRWGDKSLHTEYKADRVFAELPEARIIQLVRDPRDRHASIIRRYEDGEKGVAATTGAWIASVRQGRRNVARYAGRYRLVRYETLAARPEETLRELCGFLDERYEPEMLRMRGLATDQDRSGNSSFEDFDPGVISTRSIGRYRSVLSAEDLAFIQMMAGRHMASHGYDADPAPLPPGDRRHFYVMTLLPTTIRLLGWSALHRLEVRRSPGPPPHRVTSPAIEGAGS